MRWKAILTGWILCFLLPPALYAQHADITVRSGFLSDSIKIGESAGYYLAAHYPSDQTILFPDSTHLFTPFEYRRKTYFPTQTTEGISADSAVYYLTTFEIDRVQYLHLPVYVLQGRDCTVVQSAIDSLLITQLVAHVPDSVSVEQLPLRMNTAWQYVAYDLNFWMIVIIVVVVIILAVAVWLLFGKKIRKYFQVRRLRKKHATFLETYDPLVAQLRQTFTPPATEYALSIWKRYMEQLEARPYTKLTTPETLRLVKAPTLAEELRRIDQAIYGHNTTVADSLENLRNFANAQFERKLKEVQHAK